MVATLRICGEAASPQARARAGCVFWIAGCAAPLARVTRGPIRSPPSGSATILSRPAIVLRSTTRGGSIRCSFRWSSRSMPPAFSTPPAFSASSSRASAVLVACASSKRFMSRPPRFGQGLEDPVGGHGQGAHAGPGGVVDRVRDRAQGGHEARLADAGGRGVVAPVGEWEYECDRLEHLL